MAGCDWSEIPEDLLVLVAKRLHSLTDYLCAAQACKAWRSINHLPIPKPPFLLLSESNPKKEPMEPETELQEDEESEWESEEEDEEEEEEKEEEEEEEDEDAEIPDRGIVGLNNRKGDKIWELHLPELHHNRCIGSTVNWLVTVNKEQRIKIFNPFTRTQFHLPSQSTLPQHLPNQQLFGYSITKVRDRFLSKIVLSSTPKFNNPEPQGVVAAAIYGCTHNLAIAKLGDQSWTPLNSESRGTSAVEDVIFFRNRLYFVNRRGMLSSCADFSTHDPILPTEVSHFTKLRGNQYYLVEWSGELLLVLKFRSPRRRFPFYKTKRFQAFKFDFDREEWDEVNCLGQHSLFLGFNTSICLLASPGSTFRNNCIYFTDDNLLGYCGNGIEGGRDMGVFDLEDGTIKPHYDGISTSLYSPPVWVIPTFIS